MFSPDVETRNPEEQFRIDAGQYRRQLDYLYTHSAFYRRKLQEAGFPDANSAGTLAQIHRLPFTEKDELRRSQAESPPFGEHLACDHAAKLVKLIATCGPLDIDDPQPAITVMMPDED